MPLGPQVLLVAEQALAFHIGPIAPVLVREAAEHAANLAELTERLAQHLKKPEDAAEFRRRMLAARDWPKPAPGSGT